MASLKCEVVELEILTHPDADALEIAKVKGYQSIVRKGQFETGDLAVYIPEQSIVPEWLLRRLNLWDDDKGKGKLAGSNGDRVKAVKLRGVTSHGLIYPLTYRAPYVSVVARGGILHDNEGWLMDCNCNQFILETVNEGQDVTEKLGIVKWEPPIPVAMAGEVVALAGKTLGYDIENIKNFPEVAEALMALNIDCHITEKLHGTWCCLGIWPEDLHDEIPYKRVIVTSKGLSGKGLAFKDNEANVNNLYMRIFKSICPDEASFSRNFKYTGHCMGEIDKRVPIFFLGEVYGKGVQDLQYGLNDIHFRLFDIYEGFPGQGEYFTQKQVDIFVETMDLPFERVPVLYTGKLTHKIIHELTDGKDNITGTHIREGIVIRTLDKEYRNDKMGRVILKSVSDDYINRKNGTEYN